MDAGSETKSTTQVESMQFMLDNVPDVYFKVGPQGGETVIIPAHKDKLSERSEYFKRMFNIGMSESTSDQPIPIEEIDEAIFRNLLLYIYFDTISVKTETTDALMDAANLWELRPLVEACGKCISDSLNVNNVIDALNKSFFYEDMELKKKCLTFFDLNAKTILAGKDIMSASQQTMDVIFQKDKLPVKEIVVYETCLAWAKHQLQIQESTENPTDQQIRKILGDLLYQIRFPIMEQKEFAEISFCKNILTAEEKDFIYYFLVTQKTDPQLQFQTKIRFGEEFRIDRKETFSAGDWHSIEVADAINFTTDKDILLTAISLFKGYNGTAYNADIEVLQSTNSLFSETFTIPPCCEKFISHKNSFNAPILIRAGILYTVKAMAHGSIGYCGFDCKSKVTNGNTTFTFSRCPESYQSTNEKYGQIPGLYFCPY